MKAESASAAANTAVAQFAAAKRERAGDDEVQPQKKQPAADTVSAAEIGRPGRGSGRRTAL